MDRRQEFRGLGFAALCILTGAFVPAFAKLTTGRADPLSVAAGTNLFAGATAALWLARRGELRRLAEGSTAPRLALLGALGTAATALLFFEGASRTTATDVILCLPVASASSLVLARVFLGHPMTPGAWARSPCCCSGSRSPSRAAAPAPRSAWRCCC